MIHPEPIPIWAAHVHRSYLDAAEAQIAALRDELDSYRTLPLVPAAEHRRACDARDQALSQIDALIAKLQASEALEAKCEYLTGLVARLVRWFDEKEMSGPVKQSDAREARAWVAESGVG